MVAIVGYDPSTAVHEGERRAVEARLKAARLGVLLVEIGFCNIRIRALARYHNVLKFLSYEVGRLATSSRRVLCAMLQRTWEGL
jgi:hypothetical protein